MRPENIRMKGYLGTHGILATPKYFYTGSLKGCWRLYDRNQDWSADLCQQLTALGFVDYADKPLGQFSGNGGKFSVFVRGHNEFLT